jgi:hypothetical protein
MHHLLVLCQVQYNLCVYDEMLIKSVEFLLFIALFNSEAARMWFFQFCCSEKLIASLFMKSHLYKMLHAISFFWVQY